MRISTFFLGSLVFWQSVAFGQPAPAVADPTAPDAGPPASPEPTDPPQPGPAAAPEPEPSPEVAPAPEPERAEAPAASPTEPPPSPSPAAPPIDEQLEAVVVQDTAEAAELDAVSGTARRKDSAQELKGQATTLSPADLLSFTPGVYAQASGGEQGFRLSIRGSSIANTIIYKTGVGFYFDGLYYPGIAQGGIPPYLFEPLAVAHTEILPGGNAFDLQPLLLGGAVNFVDHTGYDSPLFSARFDVGSFWYYKGQLSSGRVVGKTDYYVSVTHASIDGYQRHSHAHNTKVVANIGYKFSPKVDTRFYFRWANDFFARGGLLTPDQIEDNPKQAQQAFLDQNAFIETPGMHFWGNKTTLRIDDASKLVFGISYDNHLQHNSARNLANAYYTDYSEQNLAPSLVYSRWDRLFGRESYSELGARNTTVLKAHARTFDYTDPTLPSYGRVIRLSSNGGTTNSTVSASNDLELAAGLWLKTGLAAAYTRSVHEIVIGGVIPQGTVDDSNEVISSFDWTGILGLRYELAPGAQVFGNLSRTIEPPMGARNDATFTKALELENQSATTVELGTRLKAGIFDGSLTYYYAALKNELLTIATQLTPMVITASGNASPTTHQGVEAGLDALLWRAEGPTKEERHELLLRQAYTFNHFHFNDDPLWESNRLPGLPKHFYQAELLLRTYGFSVGVNTQVVSEIAADYANTLWVPGYVTLGAKAAFAPAKDWDFHIDVRNITNEHYAAYVRQVANAGGNQQPVAAPGDGFGVFGGLSLRY